MRVNKKYIFKYSRMRSRQEDTWTFFNANGAIRILGIDVGNLAVCSWIIDGLQWAKRYALLLVYKILTCLC